MPTNPFRDPPRANPFRDATEKPANYVARETFARSMTNNLLAAPSVAGDVLAATSAAAQHINPASALWGIVNKVRGVESETPTFRDRYEAEQQKFPASALRAIPRLTTNDLTAGVRSIPSLMPGGETPREAFDRNLTDVEAKEFDLRASHPTAAAVGDVGADVASLLLGRHGSGLTNLIQKGETRLARTAVASAESLSADIGKVFTSPAMKALARGAGRSAETGVEAAALDIIKDENADPLETAAVAAGAQLVGSGFIGSAQGLMSGGPTKAGLKVALAAASTLAVVQVFKSATPGGRDHILESSETAFDKITFALAAGAGSAALGATRYGRGNAALSEQTRTFLDGIATVHRGTTLSLLTSWNDADESERATIERVLTETAKDPYYRGANAAERRVVSQLRNRYRTGGGI